MILFLDFDGVVNPDGCRPQHHFACLQLIEAVLGEFGQVEIVISSAWRLDYANVTEAVPALQGHFCQDIRHRVVGITDDAVHMPVRDPGQIIPRTAIEQVAQQIDPMRRARHMKDLLAAEGIQVLCATYAIDRHEFRRHGFNEFKDDDCLSIRLP